MKESEEILEDRENSFIPNSETLSAEEVIPLNNLGGKKNSQPRCCKRKLMSSTKHSECGDLNTVAGVVGQPLEDHDLNENVKDKKTQTKKRASKSGKSLEAAKKKFSRSTTSHRHCNMKESDEILEDRENSFIPNSETLSAEEVIPLNNLGGKNNSQPRCCKRKLMSSTKHSECGDLNTVAGVVGQPLEDHDLNENVKDKKTQTKKRASKSGKSLEAAKKKFSRSTASHRRRVEKHLLDIPETDLDYSKLSMRDLIRLAEAKERESNKQQATNRKSCLSETALNSNANEPRKESQEDEGVVLAPQVQVINGQIVINEESLVVSHRGLNVDDTQTYRRVEETSSKLNYHTYMNRTPVERWSKSETELFYKAMQQFGTDFGMIQHLFPGRTRRQVKAKFKMEERKHPLQLADALIHRPQDHYHFEMLIDRLKISSAPVEHDNLHWKNSASISLDSVPIEDSDVAHEARETVINQINSTLDSPKTPENEQNEEMQDSDVAHEARETVINQMNSTLDSPKTPENEQNEEMQVPERDSVKKLLQSPENASDEPIQKPAKCLFSYQSAASKPKSLFSYQLT